MSNKPSLFKQIQDVLKSKMAIGQSRHALKKDGSDKKVITSYGTRHTYVHQLRPFCTWINNNDEIKAERGRNPNNPEECRKYCALWIQSMVDRGLSASTISTRASALVKLYQCSREELGIKDLVPAQKREDIKRSRGPAVRDKNFNEALPHNKEFADFCRCTGLRRKEVTFVRGTDLVWDENKWKLFIDCESKGGRERLLEIIGTEEEINRVVEKCKAAGSNRIYPKPNGNADIHSFRAEYAARIYKKYARDESEYRNERMIFYKDKCVEKYISKNGKADVEKYKRFYTGRKTAKGMPEMKKGYSDVPSMYRCRKDMYGVVLDREAIYKTSENLGHGRDDIIPEHYAWMI